MQCLLASLRGFREAFSALSAKCLLSIELASSWLPSVGKLTFNIAALAKQYLRARGGTPNDIRSGGRWGFGCVSQKEKKEKKKHKK